MAINPRNKGALTAGKRTVVGTDQYINSKDDGSADYEEHAAHTAGTPIRKGRQGWIKNFEADPASSSSSLSSSSLSSSSLSSSSLSSSSLSSSSSSFSSSSSSSSSSSAGA